MATKTSSSKTAAKTNSSNGRQSASANKKNSTTRQKGVSAEMENSKFHHLFMEELKDIYWAEKYLVKALPKMQKAAFTNEVANAIADHLEVTKGQVARLEEIFDLLGARAVGKKCEAMEGLVEEANQLIAEEEESVVRDAGLIIAAQKVEHYEIATYGSLRTLASRMGHSEVASLLEQTLEEEKEADVLLTQVAETCVNEEALTEE